MNEGTFSLFCIFPRGLSLPGTCRQWWGSDRRREGRHLPQSPSFSSSPAASSSSSSRYHTVPEQHLKSRHLMEAHWETTWTHLVWQWNVPVLWFWHKYPRAPHLPRSVPPPPPWDIKKMKRPETSCGVSNITYSITWTDCHLESKEDYVGPLVQLSSSEGCSLHILCTQSTALTCFHSPVWLCLRNVEENI